MCPTFEEDGLRPEDIAELTGDLIGGDVVVNLQLWWECKDIRTLTTFSFIFTIIAFPETISRA